MASINECNEGASSTNANANEISGTNEQGDDVDPYEHLEFSPFVGKEFITYNDAKEFYNNYAYQRGFTIRKGSHYKSSKLGDISSVKWVCSKEGFSKNYKEEQIAIDNSANRTTPEKEKAPTRTGCKARLRIKFEEGVWKVSVFEDNHNHPLVTSPAKKRNLRSHKSMNLGDKEVIKDLRAQNIDIAKIHEYLGVTHGGKKFLKFKRKDVSNEIDKQNIKLLGVDVDSTLVHFQKKQEEDPEFFYDVEVDGSGRLKNLFWVDGRARRAFQEFGDVVTFDTTYQTNRYSMPIAPFIGVNHHRMSIIFGIAMLRSEDKAGFVWLFHTWKRAMYGKEPIAIITDQDPAMRIAIKDVFPNIVHRCCQWHVMRKARDHLGALYNLKPGFEDELKRIINRSISVSEFEKGWRGMLQNYNLGNNRHLKVMYGKRSEWVPAYFRSVFFANMSTTQRSESANSFLKVWTNNHLTMYQLVLQVEKIVESIWDKESDEDIKCMNALPKFSSLHRIEKDAFQHYTCKVMSVFKGILRNTQLGEIEELEKDALYKVNINYHPMIENWIPETFMIKINKLEEIISCSCQRYEFEGLLCSHAIKVMHHVHIYHLPNRYIMKRWCKEANSNAKRSKFERSMEFGDSQEQQALRFATLKPRVMKLLKIASMSSDGFKQFEELLDVAEQQMQEGTREQESQTCEIGTSASIPSQVILDPPISQCKGKRKKPQRFKPPSEAKKPRRCSVCGSKKGGHNSRTCPLKNVKGKNKKKEEDDDMDSAQEDEDVIESDDAFEYEEL